MIVPKQHTNKLGDLSGDAAKEFFALVEQYEEQNYNLYARSVHSTVRSIPHQHTHLIKLDGKQRKFLMMVRKPWYFRISIIGL